MPQTFLWRLFDEPEEYEERPLRDRKAEIPYVIREGQEAKAEFIRDFIALANTARRHRDYAYLIFGISDDGILLGVDTSLARYGVDSNWKLSTVREKLRSIIGDIVTLYIYPIPVKWDIVLERRNGLTFGYLCIDPDDQPTAFQVAKSLERIRTPLAITDCWIRIGESKRKIPPNDLVIRYSYQDVPYIPPSRWRRYFEYASNHEIIKAAEAIEGYQELYVENYLLSDVFRAFLDDSGTQMLVVHGDAGSGKSAWVLRAVVGEFAEAGVVAMAGIQQRQEFLPPPGLIPVYFSLRGRAYSSLSDLEQFLFDEVSAAGQLWQGRPRQPERLLMDSDLNWLICFDGFDEIWTEQSQRAFMEALLAFLNRFPSVRVVLTTRPSVWLPDWGTWPRTKAVTIEPLSERQIRDFIGAWVGTESIDEALAVLRSQPDLEYLCSYPAYLEAAMEEFGGVLVPTLEGALVETATELPATANDPRSAGQDVQLQVVEGGDELPIGVAGHALEGELTLQQPVFSEEEQQIHSEEEREEEQKEKREKETILPVRIGILLHRIYQRLWEREVKRQPLPPGYETDWQDRTGELAVKMDGHKSHFRRQTALKSLRDPSALNWLLNLGVLTQEPRRLLRFRTELTKLYFAANLLAAIIEALEWDKVEKYLNRCTNAFRRRLHIILSEMVDADISHLST